MFYNHDNDHKRNVNVNMQMTRFIKVNSNTFVTGK